MTALPISPLGAVCALSMGLFVVRTVAQEEILVQDRVEVLALHPNEAVVPGQSFALGVRIAVETEFLEENLVQLFRQRVDLPLQIQAPWLDSYPGLQLETIQEGGQGFTLILNQDVTQARPGPTLERDGRTFRCFDLFRMASASSPGKFSLAAPSVRVAYATEFRDELLIGRAPVNRVDRAVKGAAFQLLVQDFPAQGRPPAFVDAVGQFTLKSSLSTTNLQQGQALSLTIRIEGRGNIASMTPPALDHIQGWRLQGTGLAREQNALVLVATLSPKNPRLRVLPAVDFAWFDPRFKQDPLKRYQSASTPEYQIEIESPKEPEPIETSTNRGESLPRASTHTISDRPWTLLASGFLAIGALVLSTILYLRSRNRRVQRSTKNARVHSALDAFEKGPGVGIEERKRAFVSFLSTALGWSEADLLDHNLAARLRTAGLPKAQVQLVLHSLREFDSALFGGGPRPQTETSSVVRAVADSLLGTLG